MNDILVDELARITYKFKKEENVECIYFLPFESNNCDIDINFNIVIKSGKIDNRLLNLIFKYNIDMKKRNIENIANFKMSINIDESSYYNNMFDKKHSYMQKNAENDLHNAIILYDKSGKYNRLKKEISLKLNNNCDSWVNTYQNRYNNELPIYNIYKLK